MVLLYRHPNHLDDLVIGVDEVARGCLFGRVYAGAVLWNEKFYDKNLELIKDSKKLSRKKRSQLRTFIEDNSTAFGIGYIDNQEIDEINILNASYKAMHIAINNLINNLKSKNLNINFNRILVDGNRFKSFIHKDTGFIPHTCIPKGDNLYLSIASASILAKEYHDQYIKELCDNNPELDKYGLQNNQGYGVAFHYKALKEFGPTKYHRKSFNLHLDRRDT
jgi:ribonuclease HII